MRSALNVRAGFYGRPGGSASSEWSARRGEEGGDLLERAVAGLEAGFESLKTLFDLFFADVERRRQDDEVPAEERPGPAAQDRLAHFRHIRAHRGLRPLRAHRLASDSISNQLQTGEQAHASHVAHARVPVSEL